MKFLKKLFGLEKQEPVAEPTKVEVVNETPITPPVVAAALTPVEQAAKAVEILKAREESVVPAKVAPVKKSTPKKKVLKKAPAKK